MYNVQDYSVLYNNDVRPIICDGWYFIITMFAMLYVMVGILLTRENTCITASFH